MASGRSVCRDLTRRFVVRQGPCGYHGKGSHARVDALFISEYGPGFLQRSGPSGHTKSTSFGRGPYLTSQHSTPCRQRIGRDYLTGYFCQWGSVSLALLCSCGIIRWAPPRGRFWGNLTCQLLSHALTATMWGRWQARLSTDPLGAQSPYLDKILRTH